MENEPTPMTGLDDVSDAHCELLRSIGKARLIHRLAVVGHDTMHKIDRRLRMLLDH